jgi:hypothetical protein
MCLLKQSRPLKTRPRLWTCQDCSRRPARRMILIICRQALSKQLYLAKLNEADSLHREGRGSNANRRCDDHIVPRAFRGSRSREADLGDLAVPMSTAVHAPDWTRSLMSRPALHFKRYVYVTVRLALEMPLEKLRSTACLQRIDCLLYPPSLLPSSLLSSPS